MTASTSHGCPGQVLHDLAVLDDDLLRHLAVGGEPGVGRQMPGLAMDGMAKRGRTH